MTVGGLSTTPSIWPAIRSLHRGRRAAIRHMGDLDAGRMHEHREPEMAGGADAGRAEIELAGLRLGERDELRERLRLDLGIDHHQHRHLGDVGDRDERGLRVERHLGVEERIGGEDAGRRHQQRVAVGRGLGDRTRAGVAAGAGAVLDHDRLAERFRHLVADRARQHIGDPPAGNGAIIRTGRFG